MNEERFKNTLAEIACSGIPEDLNLWPQVAARIEKKNTLMQTFRTKPILIVLLLILALIFLSGVAYAINNLLGYLPGIGIIDRNTSLRVLAEPVEVTRDGVTVRIEQVVADPQRTVILYKTEGLSIKAANSKGETGPFGSPHLLILPDGSILEEAIHPAEKGVAEPIIEDLHTQGGWPNCVLRLVYPAIPANVNELTLLIPILQTMPAGAAPEDWQITFHLIPTPADLTMMPLIPIDSTTMVTSTITANRSVAEARQNLSGNSASKEFMFKLDNVIELNDGFVFSGNLTWHNSAFSTPAGSVIGFSKPRLSDRDGNEIPIEEVAVDYYGNETSRNWSYRTKQKNFAAPLTLTFDSLNFHFKTDNELLTAGVEDIISQTSLQNICGGGGGGPLTDLISFVASAAYPNIPQGRHRFQIIPAVRNVVNGPWDITWDPPTTTDATPTPAAQICLTEATWSSLKEQNKSLPPGLQGKFAFTTPENQVQIAVWMEA